VLTVVTEAQGAQTESELATIDEDDDDDDDDVPGIVTDYQLYNTNY